MKICPHAGGIGLCEMVQHLQMWDYICLSGTREGRVIEYVDQQHDQFVNPTIVDKACYQAPRANIMIRCFGNDNYYTFVLGCRI